MDRLDYDDDLLADTGSVFDRYQRPVHDVGCLTPSVPLNQCPSCFVADRESSSQQRPPPPQQQTLHSSEGRTAPTWADVASGSSSHDAFIPTGHRRRHDTHGASPVSSYGPGATANYWRSLPQTQQARSVPCDATNEAQAQALPARSLFAKTDSQSNLNLTISYVDTPELQQPTYAQIAGNIPIRPRQQGQASDRSSLFTSTHEDPFAMIASSPWSNSGHVTDLWPESPSLASSSPFARDIPAGIQSPSESAPYLQGLDVSVFGTPRGQTRRPRADSTYGASPSAMSRSSSVASSSRGNRRPRRTGLDLRVGAHGCTKCTDRFSAWADLRRHELRVHSDPSQRAYPCTATGCTMTFHDPKDLTRHLPTHNPGARLVCPHCGKSFVGNRPDNFNRHVRTQHQSQSFTETTDSGVAMSRQGSQLSPGSYSCYIPQQANAPSTYRWTWSHSSG